MLQIIIPFSLIARRRHIGLLRLLRLVLLHLIVDPPLIMHRPRPLL